MTDGIVKIHDKDYKTVAYRVTEFRVNAPLWSIITSILTCDDTRVVMQAKILDETDRIVATGHAEEIRGASQINRTSALECCETSAIGRALAATGYGGTEFASADEMTNALALDPALEMINRCESQEDLKVVWNSLLTTEEKGQHRDLLNARWEAYS